MGSSEIIINEVLTYVSYYINNSCINNIQRIAIQFYEETEIIEAKKKLWELCEAHLGQYPERKNSDKRTVAEAHLVDIIDALTKIDSEQSMPFFVAKDIERLPDRQPEELNLLSIVNRLSSIEKDARQYENTLTEHGLEIIKLKEEKKVKEIKEDKLTQTDTYEENVETPKEINKNDMKIAPLSDVLENKHMNGDESMSDSDFEKFLDLCSINDRNSVSYSKFNENKKDDTYQMEPKTIVFDNEKNRYSDAVKANSQKGIENGMEQKRQRLQPVIVEEYSKSQKSLKTDEEGYMVAGSRSKRRSASDDDTSIMGAPPSLTTVWVNNISKGNSISMKKYLNDRNIRVKTIKQTSHVDSKLKSFQVVILRSDFRKITDNYFWPEGVKCRRWIENYSLNKRSRTFSNTVLKGEVRLR